MILPTATYRLQLRCGIDFDAAAAYLPHLADLKISHLYLSPIFTATQGSTHGYDVTDPGEIDPALGGRDGYERLSRAAQAAGIGLILDLVPNHTAFTLENPWLTDVLKTGRDSAFAPHFDIHWDEGPVILPWLEQPFEALLEQGRVSRDGDMLRIGDLALPLRPDVSSEDPAVLHDHQHWRAVHWARERDGVTHRRFFNVTGLIGMRVEDPQVFADMHALVFDLVAAGHVQGLRLDHIDGLADPEAYLADLRRAVPDTPIWVEKILTGDEVLRDWPVEGTTGYEAATVIAQVLSDGAGAARLRTAWVDQTGGPDTFHDALIAAKGIVIRRDLAAELRRLITLARSAFAEISTLDPGDEALREAIIALLTEFPRYRTYFSRRPAAPEDLALMEAVADRAAAGLRSRDITDALTRMITAPDTAAETAFQIRFQQVTGALLAKSHEDTAGFRWTPYLAACEVGADPDRPAISPPDATTWAAAQSGHGLILTSSHDTKRSEDARMRLVAWTRRPDDALALIARAQALPQASDLPVNVIWYLVQAALAIWNAPDADPDPDLNERLAEHATKALREADEITAWTHPDEAAEGRAHAFLTALIENFRADPPAEVARLIALGETLALAQVALKFLLPGIPDIYRGCETVHLALTDPDNRRPVDLNALSEAPSARGLAGRKARLVRRMLDLRAQHPQIFADGTFALEADGTDTLVATRSTPAGDLHVRLRLDPGPATGDVVTFDLPAASMEGAAP